VSVYHPSTKNVDGAGDSYNDFFLLSPSWNYERTEILPTMMRDSCRHLWIVFHAHTLMCVRASTNTPYDSEQRKQVVNIVGY